MRKLVILATGLALLMSAGGSQAATKKKPVAKKPAVKRPAAKPAVKTPPRVVKGTAQMPGDNGKVGVTYTMGIKGDAPLNFTLVRAEYQVSRVALQDDAFVPTVEQKYLVLHYTVHNPNKQEAYFNWSSLRFTVVDSENVNREGMGHAIKEGTGEKYGIQLKPAQKIDVYTVIELPAKNTAPKLIVQRGEELPVLRLYFEKGQIKGLAAPLADPSDATGATPAAEVAAQKDTYYPAGKFDVKLVSVDYTDQALGEETPDEGQQWGVVTLGVRNATLQKQFLNWATFQEQLKTDDGEKTDLTSNTVLKAKRDEKVSNELEPGEEYTVRALIQIPKGTKATDLTVREGEDGRQFVYKLGG